MHRISLFLVFCFSTIAYADPPSSEDIARLADPDGSLLRRNKIELKTDALIGVVKQACGPEVKSSEIAAEVVKLGSKRFPEREQAAKRLAEIGPLAVAALRRGMSSPDAELAKRAREVCDRIVEKNWSDTLASAARVLLRQRDKASIEPLVKLLPFIHDPELESDIWYGLDRWATKDATVVEVVGRFLTDDVPARRALAANFGSRFGGAEGKKLAAGLLGDGDETVELRAAQGLIAVHDARGIPALIELIVNDEPALRWQACDLLRWIGNPGPGVPDAKSNQHDRVKDQAAWTAWWEKSKGTLDLTKQAERPSRPGLCLVLERADRKAAVVGCDGTRYWELRNQSGLIDVRPAYDGVTVLRKDGASASVIARYDWHGEMVFSRTEQVDMRAAALQANGTWRAAYAPDRPVTNPRTYPLTLSRTGELTAIHPMADMINSLETIRALPDGRLLLGGGTDFDGREGNVSHLTVFDPVSGVHRNIAAKSTGNFSAELEFTHGGELLALEHTQGSQSTTFAYRIRLDSEISWRGELPRAKHLSGTRSGSMLASLPGRVVVLTTGGKQVAEIPTGEDVDRSFDALPLARIGFEPSRTAKVEHTIDYRTKGLKSQNVLERRLSAAMLAEMGPRAVGAAAALREAKADKDEQVQRLVERALLAVGDERLRKLLAESKEPRDSAATLKHLEALSPFGEAEEVVTILLKYLANPSAKVRAQSANMLGRFRIEHNEYIGVLRHQADRILPALLKATSDVDADVRWMACHAIGMFGPKAVRVVSQLHHVIADKEERVAEKALSSIACVRVIENDETYKLIVELILKRRSDGIRQMAMIAASNGRGTRTNMPDVLMSVYGSLPPNTGPSTSDAQETCLRCLASVGRNNPKAVEFLAKVLADRNATTIARLVAAESLARIGLNAKATIPVFEDVLKGDADKEFLDKLRVQLEKLGGTKAQSGETDQGKR